MPRESQLREFIDEVVDDQIEEDRDLLEQIDGRRKNARDVTIAYLDLGDVSNARRWAAAAAPDYLKYARFAAETRLDPSQPPEALTSTPWSDALCAMQLATFAGDEEARRETAADVVEWASRSFLEECRGRENNLTIDLVTGLGAFVLDQPYAPHFETLREHYTAMDSPNIWADKDQWLASAVEGIAEGDINRVETACQGLDEYHEAIDIHDSVAAEAVNIHACFCVVFAREHGLDVQYTSEFVPESVVTHYPLN